MQIATIPTQQTAAATDAILALVLLAAALYLRRFRALDAWKAGLWSALMIMGAFATGLGAITHGFVLSGDLHATLWVWIHMALWIAGALLAAGTLYEVKGAAVTTVALPVMIGVAVVLFGLNRLRGSPLNTVIAYESIVLSVTLTVFVFLGLTARLNGARTIATGLSLTMFAAIMQALGLGSFQFVWHFDPNGTYHLLQLIGLVMIVLGLGDSFLPAGGRVADSPGHPVRMRSLGSGPWMPDSDPGGGPDT